MAAIRVIPAVYRLQAISKRRQAFIQLKAAVDQQVIRVCGPGQARIVEARAGAVVFTGHFAKLDLVPTRPAPDHRRIFLPVRAGWRVTLDQFIIDVQIKTFINGVRPAAFLARLKAQRVKLMGLQCHMLTDAIHASAGVQFNMVTALGAACTIGLQPVAFVKVGIQIIPAQQPAIT